MEGQNNQANQGQNLSLLDGERRLFVHRHIKDLYLKKIFLENSIELSKKKLPSPCERLTKIDVNRLLNEHSNENNDSMVFDATEDMINKLKTINQSLIGMKESIDSKLNSFKLSKKAKTS